MITTALPEQFFSIADELVPRASLPAMRNTQIQSISAGFRSANNEIWNSLSLPAITPRENASHSNILALYGDSQTRLEECRQEANQWLERICVANVITYEQPGQAQHALRSQVDQIYKPVEIPALVVPEDVDATSIGENEILVVHQSLEQALALTLREFLLQLARSLLKLYEGGTLGSIEWTSESMCRFIYSQREVRIDGTSSIRQGEVDFSDSRGRMRREFSNRRDEFTVIDWDITHHLTDATASNRLGLPHESPARIGQLWDATPKWLQPHAGVVKGTLFRKEAQKVASWEDTVVYREAVDVALPVRDPAVTLFNQLVLAAWDTDEVEGNRTISVLDPLAIEEDNSPTTEPWIGVDPLDPNPRPATIVAWSLGWLLIPFIAAFFSVPGSNTSYFLPMVLAVAAIAPYMFTLRGYASAMNANPKPSFFNFAIPSGIALACASISIPHMIVSKSPLSAILSVALIVFAVVSWIFARGELDKTG